MALSIVHGPPNSGRAGIVRERFTAALGRDPVLAVPTLDDVFSFQRELCPPGSALFGGTVTTFAGLFGEVASAAGAELGPELTAVQRLVLVRAAVERARPRLLRTSAQRPGFAPALDELLAELQSAQRAPEQVLEGAQGLEDSAFLAEVAEVYRVYLALRDEAGRSDRYLSSEQTIAALRGAGDRWRLRPVLLYGFDDLTGQQLSLLGALAETTEVTVAVTYEERDALAARSRLIGQLRDLTARDPAADLTLRADPGNTSSPLLHRLERGFLDPDARHGAPDGSLTILRCGGERREAEAVGGEIARLLAAGEDPASIAIAVRDPSEGILGPVLERYGIPVAVEADSAVSGTATGSALVGLLRAALTSATAADLLAYLRAPGRGLDTSADALERTVRRQELRSAEATAAAWTEMGGRSLDPYTRLREADTNRAVLGIAAETALDLAQWPLKLARRQGSPVGEHEALELRAATEIASGLEELLDLGGFDPSPEQLVSVIESMTVALWSGPASGRVRIASPYRLRAARFRTVFVVSLQDGEFPRHRGGGPFLSDEQRLAVGLPERIETEAEERYLFYACLSLPTHRLFLSHRACDEDGAPLSPSPYLDDVRALLEPEAPEGEPNLLQESLVRSRGLSEVVFDPATAPSADELARGLAARGRIQPGPQLRSLEVPAEVAADVDARLQKALSYDPAPRDLELKAVLATLAERRGFGGTTLEEYATCSYRWLVGHELRPRPLDPDPQPLTHGGAVHRALERLYAQPPGQRGRPGPESVDAWLGRGRELLDEELGNGAGAAARIGRRRLQGLLESFLRRDAQRQDAFEEVEVEASFGIDREEDPGALQFDDWELHGFIDRIDIDRSSGAAIVHDYKLGKTVIAQGRFERQRRLQLALYLRALQRRWRLSPAAGLYQPLGGGDSAVPRGLGRKEELDESLAGLGLHARDWVDEETFEARLDAAERLATEYVGAIRAGKVDRNPIDGKCPPFCTFAPICRMDRRAEAPASEHGGGNGGSR